MKTPSPSVVLATSATLTLVMLGWNLVFLESLDRFFKEGAGVEMVTVILLGLAILFWFWTRGLGAGLAAWHIPLLLALFAMRELDFDKRFTEQGVLKLRYYTGPGPFSEKIVGILVIGVILAVVWALLRRNLRDWLARLARRETGAWLVAAAILVVGVAKSIDGLDRKLAPLGIDVPAIVAQRSGRIEELLELAFVLLLIQAIACARRRA
ncbi:hypothetical protein SAMN05878503_102288 [Cereibacter ovatus]|uniref:Uncharacterized protein n=1 Tax=Cereibacter ovatus TaxID=439529 RepID=A0A285CMM7_9RHOB|nr:hypothetical protein [Cereibacter ovatus]SNX68802.1 hypothetical protein SAMN05878503_102288 [Cereibacter ovatus]